MLSLTSVFSSL